MWEHACDANKEVMIMTGWIKHETKNRITLTKGIKFISAQKMMDKWFIRFGNYDTAHKNIVRTATLVPVNTRTKAIEMMRKAKSEFKHFDER